MKELKELAGEILNRVDNYCELIYNDGHRWHLGASLIGDECPRRLWFIYRWVKQEQFSGRMQRLFNRGHLEEIRFVEWLNGIGCRVNTHDDSGKQFRISGVNGHFGGSKDAELTLPDNFSVTETLLGEFKTNKDNSDFKNLFLNGVESVHPKHFLQQCVYGFKSEPKINYSLYMNINKNTDEIYVELVKLNHELGEEMEFKASRIIMSMEAPPKAYLSAQHYKCKYCNFRDICHKGASPEKNCRSCRNCEPTYNAEFGCHYFSQIIPREVVYNGCENWQSII